MLITAEERYAELAQNRWVPKPLWPLVLDGDSEKTIGWRNPIGRAGSARYVVHIAEGPKSRMPGRIRTLRIDHNMAAPEWLHVEWEVGKSIGDYGQRKRIRYVTIKPERYEEGTRFLAELYATDPDETIRNEGWSKWEQHQHALANHDVDPHNPTGQRMEIAEFPDEWLPSKVREWTEIREKPPVFRIDPPSPKQ